MKRLTLLRHAKSSWDDPGARDIERPLNARGRRAARAMGQAMRAEHLHFDLIVASPAVRVVETLKEVEQAFGAALDAEFDERIYMASVDTLLAIARETDDQVAHLLLVGHNPGLERFALFLTAPTRAGPRQKLNEKYPTGALAEIRLPVHRWRETTPGEGELVRFVRPRDLDPDLGPEES